MKCSTLAASGRSAKEVSEVWLSPFLELLRHVGFPKRGPVDGKSIWQFAKKRPVLPKPGNVKSSIRPGSGFADRKKGRGSAKFSLAMLETIPKEAGSDGNLNLSR